MAEDNGNFRLTEDARTAINNHLYKWLAILGIGNLIALLTSLGYIFFILPSEAVSHAKIYIQNEAGKEINNLQTRLFEVTGKAIETSGKAQERAEDAFKKIDEIKKSIEVLNKDLSTLSRNDTVKILEVTETLKKNPEIETALVSVSMLHDLKEKQKIKDESFEKIIRNIPYLQAGAICAAMNTDQQHWVKAVNRSTHSNQSCKDICESLQQKSGKYLKCYTSLNVPNIDNLNNYEPNGEIITYDKKGCDLVDTNGPNYCCCNYMK